MTETICLCISYQCICSTAGEWNSWSKYLIATKLEWLLSSFSSAAEILCHSLLWTTTLCDQIANIILYGGSILYFSTRLSQFPLWYIWNISFFHLKVFKEQKKKKKRMISGRFHIIFNPYLLLLWKYTHTAF